MTTDRSMIEIICAECEGVGAVEFKVNHLPTIYCEQCRPPCQECGIQCPPLYLDEQGFCSDCARSRY